MVTFGDKRELGLKKAVFQTVIYLSALTDLKMLPSPPLISGHYVVTSENKM